MGSTQSTWGVEFAISMRSVIGICLAAIGIIQSVADANPNPEARPLKVEAHVEVNDNSEPTVNSGASHSDRKPEDECPEDFWPNELECLKEGNTGCGFPCGPKCCEGLRCLLPGIPRCVRPAPDRSDPNVNSGESQSGELQCRFNERETGCVHDSECCEGLKCDPLMDVNFGVCEPKPVEVNDNSEPNVNSGASQSDRGSEGESENNPPPSECLKEGEGCGVPGDGDCCEGLMCPGFGAVTCTKCQKKGERGCVSDGWCCE